MKRSSRPPASPGGPGEVLELLHEVPVGDVVDAVHPDAVDAEVGHPAEQVGLHELPGRDEIAVAPPVTGSWPWRKRPYRHSLPPNPYCAALAAGLLGVRIVRGARGIDVESA